MIRSDYEINDAEPKYVIDILCQYDCHLLRAYRKVGGRPAHSILFKIERHI